MTYGIAVIKLLYKHEQPLLTVFIHRSVGVEIERGDSSMQIAGLGTCGTGTCGTGTAGPGHALQGQRDWDMWNWDSATGTVFIM